MDQNQNGIPDKRGKWVAAIELIIILFLGIIVFAISSHFDLLENFVEFSSQHEQWNFDEVLIVFTFLFVAIFFFSIRRWRETVISEENLRQRTQLLEKALGEIQSLKGILPICASCKKIRDDKGYWHQVESYIKDHSEADFSHSICSDCMKKLYPEFVQDALSEKNKSS